MGSRGLGFSMASPGGLADGWGPQRYILAPSLSYLVLLPPPCRYKLGPQLTGQASEGQSPRGGLGDEPQISLSEATSARNSTRGDRRECGWPWAKWLHHARKENELQTVRSAE
jgi:hypothetical protein